jgi:hypothetical protein
MCRVKAKIEKGAIPSERIAYITTANGHSAEVILDASQAHHKSVVASQIGTRENTVLIELPRETTTGSWRVWVNKSQVLK